MEATKFSRQSSYQFVLTILIFTLLCISSIKAASSCNTTTPSGSTTSNSSNYSTPPPKSSTTIPSNSTKTNENTTIPSHQSFMTYVKHSCNSTTYPSICFSSLSPYASKIEGDSFKLCNISLTLALKAAQSAVSTITKLSYNGNLTKTEASVIQDCLDNAKDSIDELLQSLQAMQHLEGEDKAFQLSSIKTWVSAAITDDTTCSDEFEEENFDGTVRDQIKKMILIAQRMTSNALYFINNLYY
ncbi:hypothetical protein L6164_017530 [Bauhinia variegata]|uniref:Uncharacterized protein n=1 Tax=Bauhinia variegata TaxID=167791 RepID=A0ACB9N835_BAUVA|nr:hypothetical protein L6164_017530 [Bauhinia variegata]